MKYTISVNDNEYCYGLYNSKESAIKEAILLSNKEGHMINEEGPDYYEEVLDSFGYGIMPIKLNEVAE